MDSTIIGSIITGCLGIIGVIIAIVFAKKKPEKQQDQNVTGDKNTIIQALGNANVEFNISNPS